MTVRRAGVVVFVPARRLAEAWGVFLVGPLC